LVDIGPGTDATRMERGRIVILGAAGRDFPDFLVLYRGDPGVEVVAFTASQIPGMRALATSPTPR
jgi:predicted GTPase